MLGVLGLGLIFTAHGLQMAFGLFGGPGTAGFATYLAGMGFAPAIFWSRLAAYSVFLGGLCLLLGFLTRIACVPLLIFMVVAVVKVHISKGFFIANGGWEYNFIIICGLIALIILGAGDLSITQGF